MTLSPSIAGGIRNDAPVREIVRAEGVIVRLRYPASEPSGSSYPATFGAPRLSAVVRRSETGYIACADVLNAVGHGSSPELAIDDLCDSVEQYLEYLRDDAPQLAPALAYHAIYVALLAVPRESWCASVSVDAAPLE